MIEKIHRCAVQELKGNKEFVLVNKQDFITLTATVNQIIEHLNNLEEKVNYSEPIKIEMQPIATVLKDKCFISVKGLDYGGRVLEYGTKAPKKRKKGGCAKWQSAECLLKKL